MANAMPAVLWVIAAACCLLVIAITVLRSHYFTNQDKPVQPVTWTLVGAHVLTLVMIALPYAVFLGVRDSMPAALLAKYAKVGVASAVIAVLLIFGELVLMYLQAKRAMMSQIDETLNRASQNRAKKK
ncbi:C4-dicarboxylate ABC transporter [Bifidobacterium dolichotidis]|uniref:C4-dicarboxylate ABC transporter n=1 Tax=Bifidobacterium dolichotidis TaxID=2306976 RepID=A0A430FT36_9BIFI|nr:C4-dicarboxylate ABC transporter [Bifidobacterium dolichotidis]RSX56064.1 C4-dicarboxylate ABC transporter [Bifidobacterium dolichotidis]